MRENIDKMIKRARTGVLLAKSEASSRNGKVEEKVNIFFLKTQFAQSLGLAGDLVRLSKLLVKKAYLVRMKEDTELIKDNDNKILDVVDTRIAGELGDYEKAKEVKAAMQSSIWEIVRELEEISVKNPWQIRIKTIVDSEVLRLKQIDIFNGVLRHYLIKSGNPE